MSALSAAPLNVRLGLLALVVGLWVGGRGAWMWQANDYENQLAVQARKYVEELAGKDQEYSSEREHAAAAALAQIDEAKSQRHALEKTLQEQAKTHWKEMNDVQKSQDRLRDRLATADLRLSVLIATGSSPGAGSDCGLRQAPTAGGVVHGAARVELDPAHAQRIVSITADGDAGLAALGACQAYVTEIMHSQ